MPTETIYGKSSVVWWIHCLHCKLAVIVGTLAPPPPPQPPLPAFPTYFLLLFFPCLEKQKHGCFWLLIWILPFCLLVNFDKVFSFPVDSQWNNTLFYCFIACPRTSLNFWPSCPYFPKTCWDSRHTLPHRVHKVLWMLGRHSTYELSFQSCAFNLRGRQHSYAPSKVHFPFWHKYDQVAKLKKVGVSWALLKP